MSTELETLTLSADEVAQAVQAEQHRAAAVRVVADCGRRVQGLRDRISALETAAQQRQSERTTADAARVEHAEAGDLDAVREIAARIAALSEIDQAQAGMVAGIRADLDQALGELKSAETARRTADRAVAKIQAQQAGRVALERVQRLAIWCAFSWATAAELGARNGSVDFGPLGAVGKLPLWLARFHRDHPAEFAAAEAAVLAPPPPPDPDVITPPPIRVHRTPDWSGLADQLAVAGTAPPPGALISRAFGEGAL